MKAAEISAQLIAHGRDSDTPVAVISRGTRDDQQTITGTLQQLEHPGERRPDARPAGGRRSGAAASAARPVSTYIIRRGV